MTTFSFNENYGWKALIAYRAKRMLKFIYFIAKFPQKTFFEFIELRWIFATPILPRLHSSILHFVLLRLLWLYSFVLLRLMWLYSFFVLLWLMWLYSFFVLLRLLWLYSF